MNDVSDWKENQLKKWMAQSDKRVSPSRSWYWHRLHSKLNQLVNQVISEIGTGGVLLDYGGGLAPLSRHWHRDYPGWCIVVSDLSESDLKTVGLLNDSPQRLLLHADHSAIKDNSLDIIYCSEVVEHLPKPEKLLADFYQWLKPGGVLVLSTPNGGHPLVKSEEGEQAGSGELLATNDVGFGHISVHATRKWVAWLNEIGFTQVMPYRGALLFGSDKWNSAVRLLIVMMAEIVLDVFKAWNWSESTIIKAKKSE